MTATQIVPREERVEIGELLVRLSSPEARHSPFSDAIIDFCASFSAALFHDADARRRPELQALAFWMRKAELTRMRKEFAEQASGSTRLAPRGLVFHIPPSNVDTIFIYSWILAVLTGNANIIRMSERAAEASANICRVFNATLETSDPALARSVSIVRYGHEREITAAISAACDVRVLWGGDAAVNSIRAIPLPPHAKEVTFPDRYSLAAIKAESYLQLSEGEREALAGRFYNDLFWFDQMACSSPRLLIWAGEREQCERAAALFYEALEREVERKQYALASGPRLNKLTFAYRAILDQPVTAYRTAGTECAVLEIPDLSALKREHCGGGLLFQAHVSNLSEISGAIERRDQTLSHFGFSATELEELAVLLNGRGIDRLTPIGQALNFHRYWDGYDLLREFTRTVFIQT